MDIVIAAVGRIRKGPVRDLFDDYVKRLTWTVTLKEVEARAQGSSVALKRKEAELLVAALPDRRFVIALDENGKQFNSIAFSRQMAQWEERSAGPICFVIGGAEGLDDTVLAAADARLSLGTMTWPHRLVRCMLVEQLYRAQSIRAGHPYHRE